MAIGIIIGNLGTPASPSTADVKTYLKEFLMDPYVIDKPFWFRWILVNLLIAPLRSHKSAEAYQMVWRQDGSPLLALSVELVEKLRRQLSAGDYQIELAMRYGEPSIRNTLVKVKDCEKILLFPQYPQYAESSYRTWMEEALLAARELGIEEKLSAVEPFFNQEEYLGALARSVEESLQGISYDHLLFSFHGLPESHLKKVDSETNICLKSSTCCDSITTSNRRCYRAQCYYVARELAARLEITPERFSVSFQSRLGREPWIQPFTDQVLKELPKRGVKKLAVAMPAFTVDCLETLEEIHIRAREDFLQSGGTDFHPIECLNASEVWVKALDKLIAKSLAAPVKPCP